MSRAGKISPLVSSHLSSQPRLPLTPLVPLVCSQCLQAVPSALLRFAEELLLGRAVSLQRCPLAMSSLHPRSPAQLSSRGPAQGSTSSAPSGLPQRMSLGLQGNLLRNRLKESLMFPPSAGEGHLFPAVAFLSETHLGLSIAFFCSGVRAVTQTGPGQLLSFMAKHRPVVLPQMPKLPSTRVADKGV